MSDSSARPIVGETAAGVGATYVILNRNAGKTNIQVAPVGTVTTATVDWTLQNVMYDAQALEAVNMQPNPPNASAPADATWTATTLSQVAGSEQFDSPIAAIRIDITAGTGSIKYIILQE